MNELKNNHITKRNSCVDTSYENGVIILNTETGVYIELNETGKFLWEEIERGPTFNELIKILCATYQVNLNEAEDSLKKFLDKGIDEKIIEISDPK
tara:strand:- start:747 stop:1034 length:288 start_codon:yes stop_codon:yes gene_type:complete